MTIWSKYLEKALDEERIDEEKKNLILWELWTEIDEMDDFDDVKSIIKKELLKSLKPIMKKFKIKLKFRQGW